MVKKTEASLMYTPIKESDIELSRCIKLKEATIYNYVTEAGLAKSLNSSCLVIHQIRYDDDPDKAAVVHVLASLLNEPTYKTLRTKEQLGYVCKLSKDSITRTIHICIFVQSSKYDAEYLESRISEFLYTHQGFSAGSV